MTITEITTFFILTLVILALFGVLVWLLSRAEHERKDLYTRLMAGTLQQYAQTLPLIEPPAPIAAPRDTVEDEDEDSEPLFVPPVDGPRMVDGQARMRRIVGQ